MNYRFEFDKYFNQRTRYLTWSIFDAVEDTSQLSVFTLGTLEFATIDISNSIRTTDRLLVFQITGAINGLSKTHQGTQAKDDKQQNAEVFHFH